MKNGTKKRAWTSAQVRDLKTMARKKTPVGRIAKKLKRTEGATRQKAFSIGPTSAMKKSSTRLRLMF
jgi:hypothetical protein